MIRASVLCVALATALAAEDVTWLPEHPLEGSLLRIHGDRALTGELSGEPLHFLPDSAGGYVAYAAVPLGAPDTVAMVLLDENAVPSAHNIPVRRRPKGPTSQLRTAPEFTRPPDSALTERLNHERELVRAVLRGSHERPRLWSPPFAAPRPGKITSPFGATRGFTEGEETRHRGADFAGRRGDPVRAANRGVVALVADLFYAGKIVYVDHGAGLITTYAHLSRALVAAGDTVVRGQLIGSVGASGRVTGPHLHVTALYGRVAFDPADLLRIGRPKN